MGRKGLAARPPCGQKRASICSNPLVDEFEGVDEWTLGWAAAGQPRFEGLLERMLSASPVVRPWQGLKGELPLGPLAPLQTPGPPVML